MGATRSLVGEEDEHEKTTVGIALCTVRSAVRREGGGGLFGACGQSRWDWLRHVPAPKICGRAIKLKEVETAGCSAAHTVRHLNSRLPVLLDLEIQTRVSGVDAAETSCGLRVDLELIGAIG